MRANRIAKHYSQGEWLEAAPDVGRLEAWASEHFKYGYVAETVSPWCIAVMDLIEEASGPTGCATPAVSPATLSVVGE